MALVNGVKDDHPLTSSRGLAYGDGLFETIAFSHGVLHRWTLHMRRLERGCKVLGFEMPSVKLLEKECLLVSRATEAQVIKIILSRCSGGRGYQPSLDPIPSRVIGTYPWPNDYLEKQRAGISIGLCKTPLGLNPILAGLKHLNRLEQVLASAEVRDKGWDEGLMRNLDGHVIGGTKTNLFLVADDRLHTPLLLQCGVAGVLRETVLDFAQASGLNVTERHIELKDLQTAQEVFVCNAIAGILPVTKIHFKHGAARHLGIGAVTQNSIIGTQHSC